MFWKRLESGNFMDALFCYRGFCTENCERRDLASKKLSSRHALQGREHKKKEHSTETVDKTRQTEHSFSHRQSLPEQNSELPDPNQYNKHNKPPKNQYRKTRKIICRHGITKSLALMAIMQISAELTYLPMI